VARKVGRIGGIVALSFYGKHLLNGQVNLFDILFGPKLIMSSKLKRENHTIPLYAHWLLSGLGSHLGAGKQELHMMSPNI